MNCCNYCVVLLYESAIKLMNICQRYIHIKEHTNEKFTTSRTRFNSCFQHQTTSMRTSTKVRFKFSHLEHQKCLNGLSKSREYVSSIVIVPARQISSYGCSAYYTIPTKPHITHIFVPTITPYPCLIS